MKYLTTKQSEPAINLLNFFEKQYNLPFNTFNIANKFKSLDEKQRKTFLKEIKKLMKKLYPTLEKFHEISAIPTQEKGTGQHLIIKFNDFIQYFEGVHSYNKKTSETLFENFNQFIAALEHFYIICEII